jgi:hypothetical protein
LTLACFREQASPGLDSGSTELLFSCALPFPDAAALLPQYLNVAIWLQGVVFRQHASISSGLAKPLPEQSQVPNL